MNQFKCKACQERDRIGERLGSPRVCGFTGEGQFNPENWNCGTLIFLRKICRGTDGGINIGGPATAVVGHADHSIAICGIPELDGALDELSPNFLILHWYKSRGRTPLALVIDMRHKAVPLTLELAEAILKIFGAESEGWVG